MPAVALKPGDTTGCPTQVIALVEHLRGTGTYEGKLNQLIKWGRECEEAGLGAEEFLRRARTLTTGTVTKIDAYLANLKVAQAGSKEVGQHIKERMADNKAAKSDTAKEAPVEAVAAPAMAPTEEKPPVEDKPESSPAAEWNAKDAIDHIGRMTSVEKLEKIALIDERVTVTKAAESRLEELKNKPE